jgi:hypothetical protein
VPSGSSVTSSSTVLGPSTSCISTDTTRSTPERSAPCWRSRALGWSMSSTRTRSLTPPSLAAVAIRLRCGKRGVKVCHILDVQQRHGTGFISMASVIRSAVARGRISFTTLSRSSA